MFVAMTEYRWEKPAVNKTPYFTLYLLILAIILFIPVSSSSSSSNNETCGFRNVTQLPWENSLQCCQMEGFDPRITNDAVNRTCRLDNNTHWTITYEIKPWIELIGCYENYNASSLHTNITDIRLCFLYCGPYKYFGLQNNTCICITEKPMDSANTSCVFRRSTNSAFENIAVYKQANYTSRANLKSPRPGCMSVSCQNSDELLLSYHSCSSPLPVLCQDGTFQNDSVTWSNASKACENQTYPALTETITSFCNSYNVATNQRFWLHTYWERIVVVVSVTSVTDTIRDMNSARCENVSLSFSVSIHINHRKQNYSFLCLDNKATNRADVVSSTSPMSSTTTFYMGSTMSSIAASDGIVDLEENEIIYIAAGCGAGALLIVTVVIIVCCRCRKAKKQKDVEGKNSTLSEHKNTYNSNEANQENGGLSPVKPLKQAYEMVDIDNKQINSAEDVPRKISIRTSSNSVSLTDQEKVKEKPNPKQSPLDSQNSQKFINHKDQYSVVVKIGKQGHSLENKNVSDEQFRIKDYDDDINSEKEKKVTINSTPKDESQYKGPFDHIVEDDYDSISGNEVNIEKESSAHKLEEKDQKSENQDNDDENYDFIGENGENKEITNEEMQINSSTNVGDDSQKRKFEKDKNNQSNNKQKKGTHCENDEDDYDQFERNKPKRPSSNYDHVTLRHTFSNKDGNINDNVDLEDYDHLQMSPKRKDLVDSTYDHAHVFNYEDAYNNFDRDNPSPTSDTYDRLPDEDDEDDYATAGDDNNSRLSHNDYEISDEVPAVTIHDEGGRDSYYTTVSLPGTEDAS